MFRLLLLFFIIAFFVVVIFLLLDYILGHRLLIPIAKMMKFKQDDVERTEEKVHEIFGVERDEKKGKSDKRKK